MSAEGKMAPELRRNYKNSIDCIFRIAKEEGVLNLWSGGAPTVIRATLLSASVLGCYSETKEQLHKRFPQVFPDKDGEVLMFCSTMVASFGAVFFYLLFCFCSTIVASLHLFQGLGCRVQGLAWSSPSVPDLCPNLPYTPHPAP